MSTQVELKDEGVLKDAISDGTFHFFSDPPLWMSTLSRQLVGIRFQRDRQKDQRVPTKK